VQTLDDLRPGLLDEIEAFFEQYNQQSGKTFRPTGRGGPERGRAFVERGIAVRQEEGKE
jgi:inorganic pyrophosphatase